MPETILVTGATGTVGRHLVRELVAAGVRPRALVRDQARGRELFGSDVDLAVGDFTDPATVRAAMTDVHRLFLACGNTADQVESECAAIDAARATGIRRVVKLSARGADRAAKPTFWRRHAAVEAHLAASELPATVLRPSFYMSNLFAAATPLRDHGVLPAPVGTAAIAMIDPADIAAVAAALLLAATIEPGTVELTGPDSLTYHHAAHHLTTLTGRPITYTDIPPEAAAQAMIADGIPAPAADQILEIFAALRHHAHTPTNNQVQHWTGRPARTLMDFLETHAAVFAPHRPGARDRDVLGV
ncbi:NAD(P)H-binding protein [Nocardia lasii]|uniref:NAD(P)H-binding protein n=1 Tax=Nocardia lasii TaxID=1616107 RepID=A0ABW1JU52_9NOCA